MLEAFLLDSSGVGAFLPNAVRYFLLPTIGNWIIGRWPSMPRQALLFGFSQMPLSGLPVFGLFNISTSDDHCCSLSESATSVCIDSTQNHGAGKRDPRVLLFCWTSVARPKDCPSPHVEPNRSTPKVKQQQLKHKNRNINIDPPPQNCNYWCFRPSPNAETRC